MLLQKATLIQDIAEYLDIIKPAIDNVFEQFFLEQFSQNQRASSKELKDNVLRWIIAEELELIYGLFAIDHVHNSYPHIAIHQLLNNEIDISTLTATYVKAPQLYVDNVTIHIDVTARDLYIYYHKDCRYPSVFHL